MSTKAIRDALKMLEAMLEHPNATEEDRGVPIAARMEVEAIEKAAADLHRLNIGDFIYNVRERRDHARDGDDGSGWNHPDVEAWGTAANLLRVVAAQRSGGTTGGDGAKDAGAGDSTQENAV